MLSPFESLYITSYLTSIDTFSLSGTVLEIFDFKVFRVRLDFHLLFSQTLILPLMAMLINWGPKLHPS